MIVQFNNTQKKVLSRIGNGAYGREFVLILKDLKNKVSSIESIDGGTSDYGAQVEGRKLFVGMVNDIIKTMEIQKHPGEMLDQSSQYE